MKLILDKGLTTEVELAIDNYFEHLSSNNLNASKSYDLTKETVPDLSDMVGRTTCTTVDVTNDTETVDYPVIQTYTKIEEFTTSCFEEDHRFTYNITLKHES